MSVSDERRRISFVAPRGSLASSVEDRAERRTVPTISSVGGMAYYRIVVGQPQRAIVCAGPITVISAGHERAEPLKSVACSLKPDDNRAMPAPATDLPSW